MEKEQERIFEDDDDDMPKLSSEALKALLQFYEENLDNDTEVIEENWQLSQFWYNEKTSNILAKVIFDKAKGGKIALISCPTLYKPLKKLIDDSGTTCQVTLFEFDQRFRNEDFVLYDYNTDVLEYKAFQNTFDVIAADPPFLSQDCLTKVTKLVQLIKKDNSSLILCTGAIMEELASQLLNLKLCSFKPEHQNNLANEFVCFTNFGEIM